MLKLKANGNPYYDNVNLPEEYEERCKNEDQNGHQLIFGDDIDIMDTDSNITTSDTEKNEDEG